MAGPPRSLTHTSLPTATLAGNESLQQRLRLTEAAPAVQREEMLGTIFQHAVARLAIWQSLWQNLRLLEITPRDLMAQHCTTFPMWPAEVKYTISVRNLLKGNAEAHQRRCLSREPTAPER